MWWMRAIIIIVVAVDVVCASAAKLEQLTEIKCEVAQRSLPRIATANGWEAVRKLSRSMRLIQQCF